MALRFNGRVTILSCLLCLTSFVLAAEGVAPARIGSHLQAAIAELDATTSVDVIVRFTDTVQPSSPAARSQTARRVNLVRALREKAENVQVPFRGFLRELGIEEPSTLWLINGAAFSISAEQIERIAHRADVESIVLDREFQGPLGLASEREARDFAPTGSPSATPEWNIDMIGAPTLWSQGITGQSIVIGIMDSGVDAQHQDLAARWRGGSSSWFDPHGEHAQPYDATGHGTASAGILVGGSAGGTAIGLAPDARWIGVKIFDDGGSTSLSSIHQGFQWMLDPDGDPMTDDAADVINNSWGLTDDVDECVLEFESDIEMLKAAGIAVVFSAGNSGSLPSSSLSPANNPGGFAVGATDSSFSVSASSSRGPSSCGGTIYPELTAPGIGIWTTDLTFGGVFADSYTEVSGTSFAAPHVSGAMALLFSAFPDATVAELEAALVGSAFDLGPDGPDNDTGYGLIDVASAWRQLAEAPTCTDDDGDLHFVEGNDCGPSDCDDAAADFWSAPSEVRDLAAGPDRDSWLWSAPRNLGGLPGETGYDTLRSEDPADFVDGTVCVESGDGTDTVSTDGESPSVGTVWFYLVRARTACAEGNGDLGSGSDGLARVARDCP